MRQPRDLRRELMPNPPGPAHFDSWKELLAWLPQASESQLMTVFVWAGDQEKVPTDDARSLAEVLKLAFERLVERAREPLKRFLVRRQRCRDSHLADDIVQEVLIRIYLRAEQYDPQRSFWGWLYRIARNKYIDALRRVRPGDVGLGQSGKTDEGLEEWLENLSATSATPEGAALEREQAEQLEKAIARLPGLQQTVVRLRLEGVQGKEIAQRIKRSQAYVSQSFHEALEIVRDWVEK
jgi:RNA polymerase sigma factor (sigma-70 family)